MIKVKDESNLVDYTINQNEVLYITEKFQSSSQNSSTFQVSIMFKTGQSLEMVLTDTALSELVGAMG